MGQLCWYLGDKELTMHFLQKQPAFLSGKNTVVSIARLKQAATPSEASAVIISTEKPQGRVNAW